jgi:hypothetical protein
MKNTTYIDPEPWMTRKEAMAYLKIKKSALHVKMIPWDGRSRRVPGKIRTAALMCEGRKRHLPRLLKADVYAILPRPDGIEAIGVEGEEPNR